MSSIPLLPNQTLYVNNLNDKLRKNDLKRYLYELFGQYGRIVDIVALKTHKARGQAFVLFTDLNGATVAMRSLQGTIFFGKPLRIQYAKTKSYAFQTKDYVSQRDDVIEFNTSDQESNVEMKEHEPPNSILFLDELPPDVTHGVLSLIFQQCSGLKEIRLAPGQIKKAFVEFDTVDQAVNAMSILNGYRLSSTHQLNIEYAKK